MRVKMTQDFSYNGLFINRTPLATPREVEILGVMAPPDPGFVTIKDGDKQYEVPTNVLDSWPDIDWDRMLTEEQRTVRERAGMLFGNGVDGPRWLVPLADCPLKGA